MKVLVKCNIIREIQVEVDDRYKSLIDKYEEDLMDALYNRLSWDVEKATAENEYVKDICRVTDVDSGRTILEM